MSNASSIANSNGSTSPSASISNSINEFTLTPSAWFNNADVIGTILILRKKEISIPDKTKRISFWLTNKDINTIEEEDKETLINSIVLHQVIDHILLWCRHTYQC